MHVRNDPEEGEDPCVYEAAKLLLESGADPNIRDDMGFPLWLHYMLGKRNIPNTGELLLKHGLETNVKVRLITSHRNSSNGSRICRGLLPSGVQTILLCGKFYNRPAREQYKERIGLSY